MPGLAALQLPIHPTNRARTPFLAHGNLPMRHAFASLISLLAGAGLTLAGEGATNPGCAPTVPIPSVQFYQRLAAPPPACAPTTEIPSVTFYRAEPLPPKCSGPVPIPPVTFYKAPIPPVTFY